MANLCYSISGGKATVTGYNPNEISNTNTKITIPTTTLFGTNDVPVVAIGANAFKNVNTQFFKELVIQEGVKTIGESAFASMQELLKVSLPSTITSIGNNAFSGCRYVETISIAAKTAPTLNEGGLSGYGGVKIYIPFGTLSSYQSKWGTSYTYVEAAPGAGEEFTSGDFKYQVNDDGTTVTIIGYTGNATELTLGGSVTCNGQNYKITKIGEYSFSSNTTLETITIKDGITSIDNGAFEEVEALKSVNIPASVTTIGDNAFDYCQKLEKVSIAKSSKLTSIGVSAFDLNSTNLKEFTILCTTPPTLGNDALKLLPTDCKIYVPSSAVETYKAATGWSAYADQIHAAPLQVGDQFTAGNIKYQVESLDPTKTVSIIGYTGTESSVNILETVTFENENYSIAKIGDNALNSSTITEIIMDETPVLELGSTPFSSSASITVPFGSGADFKKAEGWSTYATQIKEANYYEDGISYTNISDDDNYKVSAELQNITTKAIPAEININNKAYQVTKITYSSTEDIAELTLPAGIEEIDDNLFTNVDKITVPFNALSSYKTKWATYADKFSPAYSAAKQLTDATAIADAEGYYEVSTLSYKRTFDEAGQYATLCLPFETNLSDLASAFEAVYVPQGNIIHYTGDADAALSGKFILLLEKQGATGTIAAGQPFFVKTKEDTQEVTLKNASETELKADAAPTATSMKVLDWDGKTGLMTSNNDIEVSYAGTYKSEEPNGRYTFNTDGSFGIQTEGSILPFRMQLTVTNNGISQNAPMLFSIGTGNGATTGINQIIGSNQPASAGKVYGIDGRLVNTTGATQGLAKGVYVKNGKKFIIK